MSYISGGALLKWKTRIQVLESCLHFSSTIFQSSGENPTSSSHCSPHGPIMPVSKSLLLKDYGSTAGLSVDTSTAPAMSRGFDLPFLSTLLSAKTTYEVQHPRARTKYQIDVTSDHQSVLGSVTGAQESCNLPKEQFLKPRIHICVRTVKRYILYASVILLALFIRLLWRKQEVLFLNPEC